MKKLLYLLAIAVIAAGSSCKKDSKKNGMDCDLPSTNVPTEMVGEWASGYNSMTQIVDVYNGQHLGNAWQSGKYFSFSPDGKSAELYYMANSGLSSSSATRAVGTVTFDENDGSFTFHCCWAHYKGWQNGTKTVDRDATDQEKAQFLTQKFYYSFETTGGNTWMQIRFEPGGTPSSFRAL
jgi:hypothetical protein